MLYIGPIAASLPIPNNTWGNGMVDDRNDNRTHILEQIATEALGLLGSGQQRLRSVDAPNVPPGKRRRRR